MNKLIAKYLTIGTIVAIILNPIFGIVDYLAMQEQWHQFMIIRVFITWVMAAAILYRPLMKYNAQLTGMIILCAVVTQDGYFYSMASPDAIQKLSLSYVADFVGASMVLMWSPTYAICFIAYFIVMNLCFFFANSSMPINEFLAGGGLLVLAGAMFAMAMVVFRYHSVKAMVISKIELIKSNEWMAVQNEIIEEKSSELQRSNNRLKEFAYIVSHDLKAPLRGIKNISMWIKEDSGESLNNEGQAHLKLMDKQIAKMENLIKAILEYSKSGASKANVEWINLDEMIKDVIETVEFDNRTNFKINSQIPQMKGSRIVISQVLQNLLTNSIKHNDKNIREVEIEIHANDEFFQFMIADNGPGIDAKDHDRIFDLFQTLRNDASFDSTGIGLPVAKKMVEEAGGNMWLESAPGKGSRFYFSIPVQA
ncbi:MAG TPA: ATP-binding protein [Bacteroidia bacterium]|nr:ATP-binding protein [Bacteroidia bacterium]